MVSGAAILTAFIFATPLNQPSNLGPLTQDTPPVIPLWKNGAPGSEHRKDEPETKPNPWSIGHIYYPTITVYKPEKPNGSAVIIAPGGGHRELVVGEEGTKAALYLNTLGVTAFVLKYRLARDKDSGLEVEATCLADGGRAVRLVRAQAATFGVDKNRVGMLGFSAGGEVVSAVAFTGSGANPSATDPVDQESSLPDFLAWIYPGPVGIPKELPASKTPSFILVSSDDGSANVCLDLVAKHRAAKRPLEFHLLSGGGHGFNMGNRSNLQAVKTWPTRLADWLGDIGVLGSKK